MELVPVVEPVCERKLPDEEALKAGTGEETPRWAWCRNTWADYAVFLRAGTGASTLKCQGRGHNPFLWP